MRATYVPRQPFASSVPHCGKHASQRSWTENPGQKTDKKSKVRRWRAEYIRNVDDRVQDGWGISDGDSCSDQYGSMIILYDDPAVQFAAMYHIRNDDVHGRYAALLHSLYFLHTNLLKLSFLTARKLPASGPLNAVVVPKAHRAVATTLPLLIMICLWLGALDS